MDKDAYIIDCMDGFYVCWLGLGPFLGGLWLLLPIFLKDKPFSFSYYVELDSFVFLAVIGALLLMTWLLSRRVKYEISASKILCRRGKKITRSVDTDEIQGIVKKGSILLKVANQPDFSFEYILLKKKEAQLLDVLRKIGIDEF